MILDVGCGDKARGDVNCDLLVPDSRRGWDLDASKIRNFVKADVRALPFKSGSFDLVHCSHLMEHLEDPQLGIQELRRVSRKYVIVIVPYALFDLLFAFLYHGRDYASWILWLRRNHKHYWLNKPFKTGYTWLRYANPDDLSRKNKFRAIVSLIRIPFESVTIWRIQDD